MDHKRKFYAFCEQCRASFYAKATYSRHNTLGCERYQEDRRRAPPLLGSRPGPSSPPLHQEPHVQEHPATNAGLDPAIQHHVLLEQDLQGSPRGGLPVQQQAPHDDDLACQQGAEAGQADDDMDLGAAGADLVAEGLAPEAPLMQSLQQRLPDMAEAVLQDAVDEIFETLEELQVDADDVDDDQLIEDVLGLDLLDDVQEQQESEGEDEEEVQQGRTAQWFFEHRNEQLHVGSKVTVLQQCFVLLGQKVKYNMKDNQLDELCRWFAKTLGDGNLHPPSLYMLKKIVKCPEAEEFEQHVCPNDCMCFPKLRRAKYKEHQDDCCEHCQSPRFRVKQLAGGKRLIPTRVFWYLGMKDTIKDQLFADPQWCELRGTARDTPHDFYSSREARRLDDAVDNQLFAPENSAYELGFDFGQCFAFRQYSVGVLGFRCADVPHSHRSKKPYCHVLAVIPGPKEPSSLAPYLKPLLLELHEIGPNGGGFSVTEARRDGTTRTFQHKVFISGVYGDTPALKKLQAWLAHNAILGCGWCLQRSERDGNAQYWYGYANDAQVGKLTDVPRQAKCGVITNHLTSRGQEKRALAVAEGQEKPAEAGCNGISPLVGTALLQQRNPLGLPYVDYNDLWIVPIAHASLLGLVKDFWKALLGPVQKGQPRPWYTLNAAAKEEMVKRGKEVCSTDDFGRPYRCIVNARGSWVMEDWLHWTETFSCLILAPVGGSVVLHDARLKKMWGLLRGFLIHHMRMIDPSVDEEGYKEARHIAREELRQYAELAQEHFGRVLCKYNLHMLVCRLWQQQRKRGHTAFYSEFWVEVLVQLVKSSTKYRSTTQPELVIVSHLLLSRTLAVLKRTHGLVYADEYEVAAEMRGVNLDDGVVCQMLGSGKELSGADKDAAERILAKHLKDFQPAGWAVDGHMGAGWADGAAAGAAILQYTYASQHVAADVDARQLVLKSVAYLRSVKRVSYYVQVRYEEANGERFYVACIKRFLKCARDAADGRESPEVVRLAVCDLYTAEVYNFGYGSILRVRNLSQAAYVDYPVSLTLGHVDLKLVYMGHKEEARQEGWFVKYDNASGSL